MPNLPEIIYWIIVNSNLFNKLCWNFIIVVPFFLMHEKPLKPLKYRVALPDGRTQIVTYSIAYAYSGYVADVK